MPEFHSGQRRDCASSLQARAAIGRAGPRVESRAQLAIRRSRGGNAPAYSDRTFARFGGRCKFGQRFRACGYVKNGNPCPREVQMVGSTVDIERPGRATSSRCAAAIRLISVSRSVFPCPGSVTSWLGTPNGTVSTFRTATVHANGPAGSSYSIPNRKGRFLTGPEQEETVRSFAFRVQTTARWTKARRSLRHCRSRHCNVVADGASVTNVRDIRVSHLSRDDPNARNR